MAISFQFGSAFNTAVSKNLLPWNYASAVRVKSESGSMARLSDILSPLDKQVDIKLTNTKIANVYTTLAEGVVPVDNQAPNVSGQTIFVELKAFATYTDSLSKTIVLPFVSRIELRIPNNSEITDANVETLILATYASLCDHTGAVTVVSEKMRGALAPSEI